MSVALCRQFLEEIQGSADLQQDLKAITGRPEMIALGQRLGYKFDADDLATASSTFRPPPVAANPPIIEPEPPRDVLRTSFQHYEFDLASVPGLAAVASELPRLTIQPSTVDLAAFDAAFRAEDLGLLEHPPNTPEFTRTYHDRLNATAAPADLRRDFHLINLDDQVDDPGYSEYFAAKSRVIAALEQFFGAEIRFSGSLWYPPGSYRLWHTNETQPGWRMYIVDLDAAPASTDHASFFRYQKPGTDQLVTLSERRRLVRFFKVEQDPQRLFWHCIANPSRQQRWSFGFAVPDGWSDRFPLDLLLGNASGEE